MAIFLEVNDDGLVMNAIQYDGSSEYEPSPGLRIVEWDETIRPWIGWTLLDDGSWQSFEPIVESVENTSWLQSLIRGI